MKKKKLINERKEVLKLKAELLLSKNELNALNKETKSKLNQLTKQINEQKALNNKIKLELKEINNEKLQLKEEKTHLKLEKQELKKQIQENKKLLSKYNQLPYDDLSTKYNKLEKLIKENAKKTPSEGVNVKEIREIVYLDTLDSRHAYNCKKCDCNIGLDSNIESRCYQVGQGTFTEKKRGYLFSDATNLHCGDKKIENFTTGSYTISWVSCKKCGTSMGWKYIDAQSTENNAKVGKYCLSRHELTSPQDRNEK